MLLSEKGDLFTLYIASLLSLQSKLSDKSILFKGRSALLIKYLSELTHNIGFFNNFCVVFFYSFKIISRASRSDGTSPDRQLYLAGQKPKYSILKKTTRYLKELLFPDIFNQLKENTVKLHCFALTTRRLSVRCSTMTILQHLSTRS